MQKGPSGDPFLLVGRRALKDVVEHLPKLRVRVVHGNTLTAATVLHSVPPEAPEVLLVGCTSPTHWAQRGTSAQPPRWSHPPRRAHTPGRGKPGPLTTPPDGCNSPREWPPTIGLGRHPFPWHWEMAVTRHPPQSAPPSIGVCGGPGAAAEGWGRRGVRAGGQGAPRDPHAISRGGGIPVGWWGQGWGTSPVDRTHSSPFGVPLRIFDETSPRPLVLPSVPGGAPWGRCGGCGC